MELAGKLAGELAKERGRNAAALWVAGVGAALLIAAASLFVAVRWNEIPAEGKLAIILGVTALFLVVGETVRKSLPATGGVLFHLGAFLLPVDLGAMNLKLGMSWQELLLAEGLLGVIAFGGLARIGRSKMLENAAALSVVVAATGFGAVTAFPAPFVLAAIALAVSVFRPRSIAALGWSIAAGFLPVLILPFSSVVPDALSAFGLSSAIHPFFAIGTGTITAFVLGRFATMDRDLTFAFFAIGTFFTSVLTAWISADIPATVNATALMGAFLAVEAVALLSLRDPFWAKPINWLANAADVVALRTALFAGVILLAGAAAAPGMVPDRSMAVTFAVASVGWMASMLRRHQRADPPMLIQLSGVAAALCALAALRSATGSEIVVAVAMVAAAGLLLALRSAPSYAAAAAIVVYVPITVADRPLVAFLGAVSGAAVLAAAAIFAARDGRQERCGLVTAAAIVTLAFGCVLASDVFGVHLAALVFGMSCLAIALVIERDGSDVAFGARIASLGAVFAISVSGPGEQLLVLVPLLVAIIVDAVRLEQTRIAYLAVLPLQLSVLSLGAAAGLDAARAGVLLCTAAVVWAGLSEAIGERWKRPLESAVVVGAVAGLILASGDAEMFGAAMLIVGACVLGAGLLRTSRFLAHAGGIVLILGVWIELSAGGVTALEAYAAPACLHLLFAGAHERRSREVSSWAAYAPAIVLLGGVAIIERVAGGAGWHAIVAGAVGVAAVVAGGSRRLAGPLVTGTITLGVVTVFESLAVAATIPTWAWLATAGSALVASAVVLERNGTSPVDAGRRIVDVLATNFE